MKIDKLQMGLVMGLTMGFSGLSLSATQPSPAPVWIDPGVMVNFGVASKGWADPAFSGQGWTHKSSWGMFKAKQGEKVTLTLNGSAINSLHPGLTVWYRPSNAKGNRGTGLTYVPDHFFSQTNTWYVPDAKDDTTGAMVGTIDMRYVINGFDADGLDPNVNIQKTLPNANVVGYSDGVPGLLVVTFVAAKTGNYEFVTGGIAPFPNTSLNNAMGANLPVGVTLTKVKNNDYK